MKNPFLLSIPFLGLALGSLYTLDVAAAEGQPNIIYIMSDDHACNAISAYGSRLAAVAPTPNIDRLAKEGVRLEKCFVTNSICTPSRAVSLSGQHSHVNGVLTLAHPFPEEGSGTPNVAAMLGEAGYSTALFGKWHLITRPWGFDYWKVGPGQGKYHDPVFVTSEDEGPYKHKKQKGQPGPKVTKGYYTDLITDDALAWLKEREDKAKSGAQPFALFLHHKAPHGKWEPADRHENYLADVEIPEPATLWEDFSHRSVATKNFGTSISRRLSDRRNMVDDFLNPNWPTGPLDMDGMNEEQKTKAAYQKYLKEYLRCVKAVDENVGRVLDYLDASGLSENTLVIYTSDQGFFLGEHDYFDKRWIYEECFQMPFLARLPGKIPAGSVNAEHLTSNLDFAQTLLDFAQVSDSAAPDIKKMQGVSLKPVLEGKSPKEWREGVYYRYWMHLSGHHIPGHYGIRTDRYKLAFFHGMHCNALSPAALERDPKLKTETPAGWEFYDLEADPSETRNAYDNPEYKEVIEKLKQELLELKEQYGDTDDRFPELLELRQKTGGV